MTNLEMVATSVLVGLIAGWLARRALKGGGYGLQADMVLGLVGSVVGSWIFRVTARSPGSGSGSHAEYDRLLAKL